MKQTSLANGLCVLPLLWGLTGCSSEGQVDLGGMAGSGNAAGAAGAPSSAGSPGLPQTINEMIIQLDGTEYSYSCPSGLSASVGGDWRGPSIRAYEDDERCAWPHPKPEFQLSVLFTDFLASEGLAPGTYDLAEQVEQKVVVGFSSQSQADFPVAEPAPYAIYASRDADYFDDGPPMLPAVGTSGTVTITSFGPASPMTGAASCDVSVSNIVLPLIINTGGDVPSTVTIKSARILHHWDY
jgi:hypothetical protein